MKQIIAFTLAIGLLFTAGYFASTVVSEQLAHECASPAEVNSFRNTWRDVYIVTQWWPQRDAGKGFMACIGPSSYLRYHPYDAAILSLVLAGLTGYVGFRSELRVKRT